jgi:hypothetical protein
MYSLFAKGFEDLKMEGQTVIDRMPGIAESRFTFNGIGRLIDRNVFSTRLLAVVLAISLHMLIIVIKIFDDTAMQRLSSIGPADCKFTGDCET